MNLAVEHSVPWVEKYRPMRIADIAHQEEVKEMLQSVVVTGAMPNLLLHGPPGTGKTSAVHALARELFGNQWRSRVLELNASDERGISVVRDKIKTWTRTFVSSVTVVSADNEARQAPHWKIVILDEADMMTIDAQSALRRLMEDSARNTRFAIICNYVCKIIEPITSRCATFRFEPISKSAQMERLRHLCQKEDLGINDAALTRVMEISRGDLRISITLLQTAVRVFPSGGITSDQIGQIAGCPPATVVGCLMEAINSTDTKNVMNAIEGISAEGWDVGQLMLQLNDTIRDSDQLTELQKAKIALTLASVNHKLIQGGNEHLQLLHLGLEMQSVIHTPDLRTVKAG